MSTGWGGGDPTEVADAADYELGVEYLANADITISHVRVWTGAGEVSVIGRKGRIWSTAGGQLGIATLPDDLPPGWSSHALDVAVERLAGQRFVVSYSTGGNYGATNNALDASVDSADTAVTALGFASATNGNGVFNNTPGSFPGTGPGSHPFYGVDFVYDLGIGGDTAPVIAGFGVTTVAGFATATIVATDAETLVGATYRVDWGDGAVDTSAAATLTHTYSAAGLYGVLGAVTDADGLSGYAAAAADIHIPVGVNFPGILDAVASHALASGLFEAVNGHEPKSAPDNGLTAAVWVQSIAPIRSSGLAATSGRLELVVRLYTGMLSEPQDAIDPGLLAAVSTLLAAYSGDFELGGQVRAVDLLGQAGEPLSAQAGYINQDHRLYRIMDIRLPILVNDLWQQVA